MASIAQLNVVLVKDVLARDPWSSVETESACLSRKSASSVATWRTASFHARLEAAFRSQRAASPSTPGLSITGPHLLTRYRSSYRVDRVIRQVLEIRANLELRPGRKDPRCRARRPVPELTASRWCLARKMELREC